MLGRNKAFREDVVSTAGSNDARKEGSHLLELCVSKGRKPSWLQICIAGGKEFHTVLWDVLIGNTVLECTRILVFE
jgi:hypothetical protein